MSLSPEDFELLDEEEVSADSIHGRFRKYEELQKELTEVYVPTPVPKQSEEAPVYIPTPKSYGPKPLTIEKYKVEFKISSKFRITRFLVAASVWTFYRLIVYLYVMLCFFFWLWHLDVEKLRYRANSDSIFLLCRSKNGHRTKSEHQILF